MRPKELKISRNMAIFWNGLMIEENNVEFGIFLDTQVVVGIPCLYQAGPRKRGWIPNYFEFLLR